MLEEQHQSLLEAIFSKPGLEGAAYLVCNRSATESEQRLLVKDVVPVDESHYLIREPLRLSIDSASYVGIAKRAGVAENSIVFVHSHPSGIPGFSRQDDREEAKLHEFLAKRVPGQPHGSLVISDPVTAQARIWTLLEGWIPLRPVRVLGRRFQFLGCGTETGEIPVFFDRQVRAFGVDLQRLLQRLHIGVVGAGGTGSPVIEQLTRIGVGTISIFDGDVFDATNTNRVYGSSVSDACRPKVDIALDLVRRVGLGTVIRAFPSHITNLETARRLRDCDIIFGCTDKQRPRGILVQLALRYLIPVLDLGVRVDSQDGAIRGVYGRVTTLIPGEACLFCRRRISAEMIRLEALAPGEWEALADEDYAPEVEGPAPAVISFTTAVAAQAVSELLHRLTGFMGPDRVTSEVLLFLHDSRTRTNRLDANPECLCTQRAIWGGGDTKRFLGLNWPEPCPA
jgi:molybdopterin/thiamine biosynthesis adenylyltransferase